MKLSTTTLAVLLSSTLIACGPGTRDEDGGTSTDAGTQSDAGTEDGGGLDAGADAGTDGGNDGGPGLRALTSVLPTTGGIAGGTAVELRGEGFVAGIDFSFGGASCTALQVVDGTLASCLTPSGIAGAVDVTATWPDSFFDTLVGGFTYQDAPPAEVDWLRLTVPSGPVSASPLDTLGFEALVFAGGRTEGAGQAAEIVMELGFGDAALDPAVTSTSFIFTALGYFGDRDGLNAGDLANDVYTADRMVPATPGTYRVALRASLAGGPWVYGDLTGSEDGYSAADLPVMTVEAPTTITVDGVLDATEWGGATEATATDATDWTNNQLDRLLLKIADGNLYLAVEGSLDAGNAWVVYLDGQRGDGAGLVDPTAISDGTGVLDDALSSAITTPGDVNVDLAWGTVDLSRTADEFDDRMGWRALAADPTNLAWIASSEAPTVCGAAACEASVPLTRLGSTLGVPIAVFARLVSPSGQQASNQCLPADAPLTPLVVTNLLEENP